MASIENLSLPTIARLAQGAPGTVPDNFDPNNSGGGSYDYDAIVGTDLLYNTVQAALDDDKSRIYVLTNTSDDNVVILTDVSITLRQGVTWSCQTINAANQHVVIKSSNYISAYLVIDGEYVEDYLVRFAGLTMEYIIMDFTAEHNVNNKAPLLIVEPLQFNSVYKISHSIIATSANINPTFVIANISLDNTTLSIPNMKNDSVFLYDCNLNKCVISAENAVLIDQYANHIFLINCYGVEFEIGPYNAFVGEGDQIPLKISMYLCNIVTVYSVYGIPDFELDNTVINNVISLYGEQSSRLRLFLTTSKISSLQSNEVVIYGSEESAISGLINTLYFTENLSEDLYLSNMIIDSEIILYTSANRIFMSNVLIDEGIKISIPNTYIVPSYEFDADNLPNIYMENWRMSNCDLGSILVFSIYENNVDAYYVPNSYISRCRFSNCRMREIEVDSDGNAENTELSYCKFTNCIMYGLRLYNMIHNKFTFCEVTDDTYMEIYQQFEDNEFIDCRFSDSIILIPNSEQYSYQRNKFMNCTFNESFEIQNLYKFDFTNCDFHGTIYITLDIGASNFNNCVFSNGFEKMLPDNFDSLTNEQKADFFTTSVLDEITFTKCKFGTNDNYFDPYIIPTVTDSTFDNCQFRYTTYIPSLRYSKVYNCSCNETIQFTYDVSNVDFNNCTIFSLFSTNVSDVLIRNSFIYSLIMESTNDSMFENTHFYDITMPYMVGKFTANSNTNTLYNAIIKGCIIDNRLSVPGINNLKMYDTVVGKNSGGIRVVPGMTNNNILINAVEFYSSRIRNIDWRRYITDDFYGSIVNAHIVGCYFTFEILAVDINSAYFSGCSMSGLTSFMNNMVFTGCNFKGVISDNEKNNVAFTGCFFDEFPPDNIGDTNLVYNGCAKLVEGAYLIHN
jgi:uncharacterized protein YjbI with pentapeptide repeats